MKDNFNLNKSNPLLLQCQKCFTIFDRENKTKYNFAQVDEELSKSPQDENSRVFADFPFGYFRCKICGKSNVRIYRNPDTKQLNVGNVKGDWRPGNGTKI